MSQYQTPVPFTVGGLDLVSSEGPDSFQVSRVAKNLMRLTSGNAGRRWGSKIISSNEDVGDIFGVFTFNQVSEADSSSTSEVILCSSNLFRVTGYWLEIEYLGTGTPLVEFLVDSDTQTWVFRLYEGSEVVFDKDVGAGVDETDSYQVTDLAADINAALPTLFKATIFPGSLTSSDEDKRRSARMANLGSVAPLPDGTISAFDRRHMSYVYRLGEVVDDSNVSAAFMESTPVSPFNNKRYQLFFYVGEMINSPIGSAPPLSGTFAARNSSSFENVTHAEINGCLYVSSMYDDMVKYDGVDAFRAGMGQGAIPSAVGAGSGTLGAGTRYYSVCYVQIDAAGNEVEGLRSVSDDVTTASTQDINVTVDNLQPSSGYLTSCAIVNGAQSGVTVINVDNGSGGQHTMHAGQTAYFYDGVSASYVERTIIQTTSSTIKISGAAVNVADNAVISANLRIRIYRTANAGTLLRRVVDLPNNSFASTQTYKDSLIDANLGTDYPNYEVIARAPTPPPRGAYLCVHQGLLVAARFLNNPRGLRWSSSINVEHWPETLGHQLEGGVNDTIRGTFSAESFLWVHKNNQSFVLAGTLFDLGFQESLKGDAVGCIAHATIAKLDSLTIWLAPGGVYGSYDGQTPFLLSAPIQPIFEEQGQTSDEHRVFRRAVAFLDKFKRNYVLHIPKESEFAGGTYVNEGAETWLLDLSKLPDSQPEWFEWSGLNMSGGIACLNREVFWVSRGKDVFSNTAFYLHKRLFSNNRYDYVDHVDDIPWEWAPGWFDAGDDSVDKKAISLQISAFDSSKTASCTFQISTERNNVDGLSDVRLTQSFGQQSGAGGFGRDAYAVSDWGSPSANISKFRRLNNRWHKTIRPRLISGGIYDEIVFNKLSVLIATPFKIDMKFARKE